MLVIREQQMEILQRHAEDDFVERLTAHLRENQDAETYQLSDAELRARVERGIEKARSYGLTWEKPIAFFVQLMFSVAPDFDVQDNIWVILTDDFEEPNEKMDYLLENTTDEDWEEAAENYNDWNKAQAGINV